MNKKKGNYGFFQVSVFIINQHLWSSVSLESLMSSGLFLTGPSDRLNFIWAKQSLLFARLEDLVLLLMPKKRASKITTESITNTRRKSVLNAEISRKTSLMLAWMKRSNDWNKNDSCGTFDILEVDWTASSFAFRSMPNSIVNIDNLFSSNFSSWGKLLLR